MAKTTVTKEMAEEFPSLADKVGQTVDASVVQSARSSERLAKRDADRAARKQSQVSTPAKTTTAKPKRASKKRASTAK